MACEGAVHQIPGIVSVPNNNPVLFADAIMKLVRSKEKRKQIGALGREYVLANLTWDAKAQVLENIYFETLSMQFS